VEIDLVASVFDGNEEEEPEDYKIVHASKLPALVNNPKIIGGSETAKIPVKSEYRLVEKSTFMKEQKGDYQDYDDDRPQNTTKRLRESTKESTHPKKHTPTNQPQSAFWLVKTEKTDKKQKN